MSNSSENIIKGYPHIPYLSEDKTLEKSKGFYNWVENHRSIRKFSDKPVPKKVIENILKSASTAPSGAHKEP